MEEVAAIAERNGTASAFADRLAPRAERSRPRAERLRLRLERLRLRLEGSGLRAYLAGIGAGAALVAGALVAFLAIATLVAFDGLPFGLGEGEADSVAIAGSAAVPAAGNAVTSGAVLPGGSGPAGPGPSSGADQRRPSSGGLAGDRAGDLDQVAPAPAEPPPATGGGTTASPAPGGTGALAGATGTLEEATGLGADLPSDESATQITEADDDVLDGIGGLVDEPKLAGGAEPVAGAVPEEPLP